MVESHEIHAMSRALGQLEASVTAMRDLWMRQEQTAAEGRRLLHTKFDELKTEVTKNIETTKTLAEDLSEIRPAIDEFKNQRQRQIGARNFGRYLWSAMLAAAGGAGWFIHEWLSLGAPKVH